MPERSVIHDTFVIERTFPVPPARVYRAWADPAAKARWFAGPAEGDKPAFEQAFRVGGREVNRGGPPGGPVFTFEAHYRDIVPDRRIVYEYEMRMGDTRISVSLATVEFAPDGAGTRLTLTEQGAYLDGHDHPSQRRQGTHDLLDALGRALAG